MTRILLADDDALIREGLRVLLSMEADFELVAIVENGQLAIDFARHHAFDVALLDVRMPVLGGLEAAAWLKANTEARSVMLTTFADEGFILEALKAGASGYMLKGASPDTLKQAIRLVARGGTVWDESVMNALRGRVDGKKQAEKDDFGLSERESDVANLIAKGLSNKEIAEKLFMSEGTVKNHVSAILDKTSLEHRTQIAILILQGGFSKEQP